MTSVPPPALSDEWRINKSTFKPIELAYSLQALRKIIGSIDPKYKSISYAAHEVSYMDAENNTIVIDPAFAQKATPINGLDFDILVGLAVHEAHHALLESDLVQASLTIGFGTRAQRANALLKDIIKIGEEIYIDNYPKRHQPLLGKYITAARKAYKTDQTTVDWTDLLSVWMAVAVYGIVIPQDLEERILLKLSKLMPLTQTLMSEDISPAKRPSLYINAAQALIKMEEQDRVEKILKNNPAEDIVLSGNSTSMQMDSKPPSIEEPSKDPSKESQNVGSAENKDASVPNTDINSNKPQEPDVETSTEFEPINDIASPLPQKLPLHLNDLSQVEGLSTELISQTQQALDSELEDITQAIIDTLHDNSIPSKPLDIVTTPIIWSKALTHPDSSFNPTLAQELIWVRLIKNTIGHQTYRAELQGTLDNRRLHRASIDGAVFKVKRKTQLQKIDLVLLLDASGSMGEHKVIYQAAQALHKVIPETRVLSYNCDTIITIQDHTGGGKIFHAIVPLGNTPSGLALLATAGKFPKSLIIHFTDGGTNTGPKLPQVFPIIQKEYPTCKVVNIQLNPTSGDIIPEILNFSKTAIIKNVNEFPAVLKESLGDWYRV